MMERETIQAMLPKAFMGLSEGKRVKHSGKVRDWYALEDSTRLMVTTDRISAFDRIVSAVPWKGQVLNELSAWWNERTADIVPNHLISVPDPNVSIVREALPLSVEVIVRGYITGVTSTALWRRYAEGERGIYGYSFPEGLRKNQRLASPIITPTTKAEAGQHDERLTIAEVADKGFVEKKTWNRVMEITLALFARGSEIAGKAGLILVDTKYEFGIGGDGNVMLIDEIHTPDSSRFWRLGSYAERFDDGREPELFDKEFVRMRYADIGYRGDGEIPILPDSVWADTGILYQTAYELLTGRSFVPGEYPVEPRLRKNLETAGILL
ncbi:MAG: phosphoribosylaminoimidazolesuccinocarboxamide synthase [Spirochaetales bacterium]|jgi:phosphoribosylaminoimidazole-succinocarboxamide synthase